MKDHPIPSARGAGKITQAMLAMMDHLKGGVRVFISWSDGTWSEPKTHIGVARCWRKQTGRKGLRPRRTAQPTHIIRVAHNPRDIYNAIGQRVTRRQR